MRQFAVQDVGENLGIAVRVRWETCSAIDAVFVEDSQTAEVLESWVVVAGEAECVVSVQPAVVGVPSFAGAARDDLCVGEGFGHGVFECVDCAHGFS